MHFKSEHQLCKGKINTNWIKLKQENNENEIILVINLTINCPIITIKFSLCNIHRRANNLYKKKEEENK